MSATLNANVVPAHLSADQRGVHKDRAAGDDRVLILVQRGQVHHNQHVRLVDDRRAHRLIREDDRAVGSAAAHFRAVGRQPAQLATLQESLVGKEFPGKQDALSAKAGN